MLEKLPDALGEALTDVRAGLAQTLYQAVDLRQGMGALQLSSPSFIDHAPLPVRCTADGEGLSPALQWLGVPAAATELVLLVEDADSPTPQPLVHAIAHRLPADACGALAEAALNGRADEATAGSAGALVALGRNSLLQARWLPPDPPPGHGVHRYAFQLFALGAGVALPEQPGRDALRQALQERGLASGCLIGTWERPSGRIEQPAAEPLGASFAPSMGAAAAG